MPDAALNRTYSAAESDAASIALLKHAFAPVNSVRADLTGLLRATYKDQLPALRAWIQGAHAIQWEWTSEALAKNGKNTSEIEGLRAPPAATTVDAAIDGWLDLGNRLRAIELREDSISAVSARQRVVTKSAKSAATLYHRFAAAATDLQTCAPEMAKRLLTQLNGGGYVLSYAATQILEGIEAGGDNYINPTSINAFVTFYNYGRADFLRGKVIVQDRGLLTDAAWFKRERSEAMGRAQSPVSAAYNLKYLGDEAFDEWALSDRPSFNWLAFYLAHEDGHVRQNELFDQANNYPVMLLSDIVHGNVLLPAGNLQEALALMNAKVDHAIEQSAEFYAMDALHECL